ncbi:MAG: hypothetical protein WDN76_07115 [Alphaproteobacteria bacterium]
MDPAVWAKAPWLMNRIGNARAPAKAGKAGGDAGRGDGAALRSLMVGEKRLTGRVDDATGKP